MTNRRTYAGGLPLVAIPTAGIIGVELVTDTSTDLGLGNFEPSEGSSCDGMFSPEIENPSVRSERLGHLLLHRFVAGLRVEEVKSPAGVPVVRRRVDTVGPQDCHLLVDNGIRYRRFLRRASHHGWLLP